jgi:ribonuclease VapC
VILDTSAIVAIVLDETERPELLRTIDAAHVVAVAAPTLVGAGIVLSARIGDGAAGALGALLDASDAVVIEFGPDHWREAIDAWCRFGRGRHPARLNLGDCLAYAAAHAAGLPILARGDDFARTDIDLA